MSQKNLKFTCPPPEGNGILFHPIFSSLPAVLTRVRRGRSRPPQSDRVGGRSPLISAEHVHSSLSHIHVQGPSKQLCSTNVCSAEQLVLIHSYWATWTSWTWGLVTPSGDSAIATVKQPLSDPQTLRHFQSNLLLVDFPPIFYCSVSNSSLR